MGERTGSRVLQWVWSYVMVCMRQVVHVVWEREGEKTPRYFSLCRCHWDSHNIQQTKV
ncbi:hypothetical protein CCHR01_14599 [Colletotrichum chrysophilum]|uniref:Uncharacterized protein n=1 Tax=Colletotrichum chrysophilum TaxID=1836956 RepID=A0AAD9A781_9PEZI|nr:hypothetical protein CCHR01_14599 [Colletotrichum chrysophilum]